MRPEYEQQLMAFAAYRWHKALMVYLPPIIIAVGTVGNVLSVVTLTRKPMRRYSTFSYLAVLAVADTVVIYVGLCRLWLAELTGVDLRDISDWSCKIVQFFSFTASDYSGWLIVAVTVERWLAVARPLSAPRFCSRSRACKVSVVLLLALSSVNVHFFWTVRIVHFRQGDGTVVPSCYYTDDAIKLAWPWVDAVIYSFVPFVAIVTLNALIVRQVVRAKKERVKLRAEGIRTICPAQMQSSSLSSSSDRWRNRKCGGGSGMTSSLSAPSTPVTSHSHVGLLFCGASSSSSSSPFGTGLRLGQGQSQGYGPVVTISPMVTEESGKITAMLLAISFAFLLCTLPINVALIASKLLPDAAGGDSGPPSERLARAVTFRLVRTALELLMYVNHAINFYLYVASGSRFRSHVVWMLKRGAHNRRRSAERSSGGAGAGGQKGAESSQLVWPCPQLTGGPEMGLLLDTADPALSASLFAKASSRCSDVMTRHINNTASHYYSGSSGSHSHHHHHHSHHSNSSQYNSTHDHEQCPSRQQQQQQQYEKDLQQQQELMMALGSQSRRCSL